jgi:hypothetical protein
LTSTPTWWDTFACSAASAFFGLSVAQNGRNREGRRAMEKFWPSMAQRIAQAASVAGMGSNKTNVNLTVDPDKVKHGAGEVKEQATEVSGKATEGTR